MDTIFKKRLMRTFALCLAALVIGAGIGFLQISHKKAAGLEPAAGDAVAGSPIAPQFTLINQDKEPVTERSFPGKYLLIYFGYTACPDECPNSLQKMAKVLNAIGDESGKIQPLFITVDPERDTPDVLKQYVALFHPRLEGLTGTTAQTGEAEKNFKVYAAKTHEEAHEDHHGMDHGDMHAEMVNHSDYIYLIGPKDTLLGIYQSSEDTDAMAKDIAAKL